MRILGIIRRIEGNGRVMLPKEILKHIDLEAGDKVEIFLTDENDIVLKKLKEE